MSTWLIFKTRMEDLQGNKLYSRVNIMFCFSLAETKNQCVFVTFCIRGKRSPPCSHRSSEPNPEEGLLWFLYFQGPL